MPFDMAHVRFVPNVGSKFFFWLNQVLGQKSWSVSDPWIIVSKTMVCICSMHWLGRVFGGHVGESISLCNLFVLYFGEPNIL